jgi:hypothetical protein
VQLLFFLALQPADSLWFCETRDDLINPPLLIIYTHLCMYVWVYRSIHQSFIYQLSIYSIDCTSSGKPWLIQCSFFYIRFIYCSQAC